MYNMPKWLFWTLILLFPITIPCGIIWGLIWIVGYKMIYGAAIFLILWPIKGIAVHFEWILPQWTKKHDWVFID